MFKAEAMRVPSSVSWPDLLDDLQKPFSRLSFPDLMAAVDAKLSSPLGFADEFLSLQKVRNCLEHRAGVVRRQDIDAAGTLTLTFPRMKVFYMRGSEEVEIQKDERVDACDGEPAVQLLGRLVPRSRTYRLGERITFTASEFSEIAMACSYFGNELANKLPAHRSAPN